MEENQIPSTASDSEDISLLDIALLLAENWKLLIVGPLAAGLVALGISFLVSPTYTAVARILPPAQSQSASAALAAQLGTLAGLIGTGSGLKNPADQYVALLRSRTVFDAMIKRFRLKELYEVEYLDDARQQLELRTTLSANIKSGLISIEVDDHDPRRAADMANAFVEELRSLTNTLAITEAAQRRLFFEQQLSKIKESLTKSELALQTSGVSEAVLRTLPQSALESLARLKAQITAQEIKLASMRTFMTDDNPELRIAVRELSALREELAKAERSSPAKSLGDGVEYVAKYRDFKYHEALFEVMAKQYELAKLDEAREGAVIQVVDPAQPPERKSKPKRALIAVITTLLVFVLTLVGVLIRHAWRDATADPIGASKAARLRELLRLRRG